MHVAISSKGTTNLGNSLVAHSLRMDCSQRQLMAKANKKLSARKSIREVKMVFGHTGVCLKCVTIHWLIVAEEWFMNLYLLLPNRNVQNAKKTLCKPNK